MVLADLPPEEYAGASTVAEEIAAPKNYLGKLLQSLSHAGLLESQKGFGGGFRLARDPQEISLLDVLEPIEQVSRWSQCMLGHGGCSDESPCALHSGWKVVRDGYLRLMRETTLADLQRQQTLTRNAISGVAATVLDPTRPGDA